MLRSLSDSTEIVFDSYELDFFSSNGDLSDPNMKASEDIFFVIIEGFVSRNWSLEETVLM